MIRLRRLFRSYGFDLLTVLAAAESALEIAIRHDPRAPTISAWFAAPALVVVVLPLLGRRRYPFGAPAAVWLLAVGLSFIDGRLVPFTASASLAGFAAALLLGRLRDAVQARLGLVIVVGAGAIIINNDPTHATGQLIFTTGLFAIGWVAGFALRARSEQVEVAEGRARAAEHEREMAARIAAAEERTRIARELHDIVAHAVSVMVLHVGSVRHQLPETLSEDRDALQDVEKTGRTALVEMRQLLGAMRQAGEGIDLAPQPGLDGLDALLEQLARAGLTVDLQIEGPPVPLPRALDVSAFRIIQEGLTNVLKHGQATRAELVVRHAADALEIEVRNDGNGRADNGRKDNEHGFGLVGIRERVKLYGGEVTTHALSNGGFVLSTRLPLEADRR